MSFPGEDRKLEEGRGKGGADFAAAILWSEEGLVSGASEAWRSFASNPMSRTPAERWALVSSALSSFENTPSPSDPSLDGASCSKTCS